MTRDDEEIAELVKYAELLLLPTDEAQEVVVRAIANFARTSAGPSNFRLRRALLFRAVTEAALKKRRGSLKVTH